MMDDAAAAERSAARRDGMTVGAVPSSGIFVVGVPSTSPSLRGEAACARVAWARWMRRRRCRAVVAGSAAIRAVAMDAAAIRIPWEVRAHSCGG